MRKRVTALTLTGLKRAGSENEPGRAVIFRPLLYSSKGIHQSGYMSPYSSVQRAIFSEVDQPTIHTHTHRYSVESIPLLSLVVAPGE